MVANTLNAPRRAAGVRTRLLIPAAILLVAVSALAPAGSLATNPVRGDTGAGASGDAVRTVVSRPGDGVAAVTVPGGSQPRAQPALASGSAVARTSRFLVRWSADAPPVGADGAAGGVTRTQARSIGRQAVLPGRLASLRGATGAAPRFVRVTTTGAAIYDQGSPLGAGAAATLARIAALPGVASVEPDPWYTIDAATLPNDPRRAETVGPHRAAVRRPVRDRCARRLADPRRRGHGRRPRHRDRRT